MGSGLTFDISKNPVSTIKKLAGNDFRFQIYNALSAEALVQVVIGSG